MISKKILFLNFLLVFIISGCFQNYEIFGYKKTEKDFDWGRIGAKIKGSKLINGRQTIIQAPYELFIWFDSKTQLNMAVKILEIKLKNSKSGKIIFHEYPNFEKQFKKDVKESSANFSFKGIKMDYEDIELYLKFGLQKNNLFIEEDANLIFKKDYQKKRVIISH